MRAERIFGIHRGAVLGSLACAVLRAQRGLAQMTMRLRLEVEMWVSNIGIRAYGQRSYSILDIRGFDPRRAESREVRRVPIRSISRPAFH
jgi:hypothetical protein